LSISILFISCSKKVSCPTNHHVKKDKNGNVKKPAQTRLFPKNSKIKYYKNEITKESLKLKEQ
jgi:hypothetical protein